MLANNGTFLANIGLDDASGRFGINMKSDGSEDFTITQNGNVGIGTTTPNNKLQIGSTTYGGNSLAMGNGTQNFAIDITNRTIPTFFSDNNFSFMASGGGNGNVGIGTTAPTEILQIGTESTGPTARKTIKIGSGGYSAPAAFQTNSTGDKIILYNADGYDARIGIGGTTDMWFKSSDGATGGQFRWYTGAGANLIMQLSSGSLSMTGGAYCNGTSWVNASDSRLKRDIQPMTNYGLSTVMQLKPVTYFYKADKTNHPEVGFIAQEVQKIVPEVVSGTEGDIEKGETLGLSYGNLVPVLTKAIQEQQSEISSLKSEMEQMKSDIQQLKSGSAPSNAGFGGNNIVVLLSVIGIAAGFIVFKKVKK